MNASQKSVGFGSVSRRTFLGATALGAATLATGGLQAISPARAEAAETTGGETYGYTSCSMCNQVPFCGLRATLKDGKIVRVDGNPDHPKNKPCLKGLTSVQALYDPNRLLYPIKRTNPTKAVDEDPGWVRISWDEALDTIASKLNEAKEKYGADSVMFSAGDPKENIPALNRIGNLFGSANIAYGRAQCAFGLAMSGVLTFGTLPSTLPTKGTKVHLQWGSNIAWSMYPMPTAYKGMLDAKKAGVKYIVVDTRLTPTAVQLADVFLQPRTGTDGALALAIANVIIEEDLYNHEFVDTWTEGFDEYKAYVKDFTPEKAEEITWVPADKIREAARLWAGAGQGTMWAAPHATTHHTNGVQSTRAIVLLNALMGYFDIEGCATVTSSPTSHYDYSAPPAFKLFDVMDEKKDRRAGVDRWPVWSALERHTQNNGLVEYINDGIIHAGLFVGTNLMVFPQTHLYQEAIAKLDFAAAIDLHVNSWTHNVMDIVLPTTVCWERTAPYQIQGGRVFWNEVVSEPAGEAREDWKILLDLGCRLGFEEECFHGDIEAALQSMLDCDDWGFTVEQVRAAMPKGLPLPVEAAAWTPKKHETGGLRKDGKPGFNTPSGKVEFKSGMLEQLGFDGLPVYEEPHISPVATPDLYEKYPLILGTGSRIPWYVHSKYRHTPWLSQFMPEPLVFMSPEDAEDRGIADGDSIRVFNQLGEVHVKAGVSNIMRPGIVEFHHGWENANSCELIDHAFDPISGFPSYKDGLCQIEKE